MKILDILGHLVRNHRGNSELTTKYFNSLYMHLHIQDCYFNLNVINPDFKTANPKEFISSINMIFKRVQKNSMFVHNDRSSNALIEF